MFWKIFLFYPPSSRRPSTGGFAEKELDLFERSYFLQLKHIARILYHSRVQMIQDTRTWAIRYTSVCETSSDAVDWIICAHEWPPGGSSGFDAFLLVRLLLEPLGLHNL
jgi:hypothetical protein